MRRGIGMGEGVFNIRVTMLLKNTYGYQTTGAILWWDR